MASRSLTPSNPSGQLPGRLSFMDPFRLFQQSIDSILGDIARASGAPAAVGGQGDQLPIPRINVEENDDEIRITAELPGVRESNVHVTVDNDVLVIAGEKKQEREVKEGDVRVVERAFGRFRRALQLPFAPDLEKVQASCRDGVLTITVPKEMEHRNRKREIEVKRGDQSNAPSSRSDAGFGARQEGAEQKREPAEATP